LLSDNIALEKEPCYLRIYFHGLDFVQLGLDFVQPSHRLVSRTLLQGLDLYYRKYRPLHTFLQATTKKKYHQKVSVCPQMMICSKAALTPHVEFKFNLVE
jgi:hypothetical protein